MRRLSEAFVRPDDDGVVTVEVAEGPTTGLVGTVEPLRARRPRRRRCTDPCCARCPRGVAARPSYAAARSRRSGSDEISQRSGSALGGRHTAVCIAVGSGTVCNWQSFQIAAGTIASRPALGARVVVGAAWSRRSLVGRRRGGAALGAIAGGQVDDGRGRDGSDQDDAQAELPAERSAGLAEEHQHPVAWRAVRRAPSRPGGCEPARGCSSDAPSPGRCTEARPDDRPAARCLADDHLAAVRAPAKAGRHVQRRPPVAAVLQLDRLPGVDPDPDLERKLESASVSSPNRAWRSTAARIAWRADVNTASASSPRTSTSLAAVRLDPFADDVDELGGQPRSRFVPVLLGVAGVAAHVGDEECVDARLRFVHNPVSMRLTVPNVNPGPLGGVSACGASRCSTGGRSCRQRRCRCRLRRRGRRRRRPWR